MSTALVTDAFLKELGRWQGGIKADEVLSDLRRQQELFSEEGHLYFNGEEVGGDQSLVSGELYVFIRDPVIVRGLSPYELCNAPLPSVHDGVTTKSTTAGFITVKHPAAVDSFWRQRQLQFQQQLSQAPSCGPLPGIKRSLQEVTGEDGLVYAIADLALEPVNDMVYRENRMLQRPYKAYWTTTRTTIQLSRRRSRSGLGDSGRRPSSGGLGSSGGRHFSSGALGSGGGLGSSSRRLSSGGLGSVGGFGSSSRRLSSGGLGSGSGPFSTAAAGAAAADAAAAGDGEAVDAAAAAAVALEDRSPTPAVQFCMEPFNVDMDIDLVRQRLRDQAIELSSYIRESREKLIPDLHFRASARAWHQEQQLLRANMVVGGSSSSSLLRTSQPYTPSSWQFLLTGSAGAATASTAAAAVATLSGAAATLPMATPMTSLSSAAALPTAARDKFPLGSDEIVLVTGEVKPASVVCQAFGLSQDDFLKRVGECTSDSEEDRQFFSLAAQLNAAADPQKDKAHLIVSQAIDYAFFSGSRYFIITCYSLLWIGELVSVEEVQGEDSGGTIRLAAAVRLSEPIFGKDAGPDYATQRGAYRYLAHLVLREPCDIKQIAKPDAMVAQDIAVAVGYQQGGPGDDDNTRRDRGDQQRRQQQQQEQPTLMMQQVQAQQQQQQEQQAPGSHQKMTMSDQPYKLEYNQFTYRDLQLHCLISEAETVQVIWATYHGQDVVVKTLSLHWKPVGSHLHETVMYGLLRGLQLSGVLCRLLCHGEYYGLRYCMVFTPALGSLLSQLPRPYSPDVQQAVIAAVAKLHQHGVIHDDLHENNIFVQLAPGAAPKATIIDLGRARPVTGAGEIQLEMEALQQMLQ